MEATERQSRGDVMKRYYGNLLIVLGVLATAALLMPDVREISTAPIRLTQACFGLALLFSGYFLTRKSRTHI
jgi:hypothetical protein